MIVVLQTKPSGLYRHRRGLGLHRVGLQRRNLHIWSPSLPSMPRRVPSRHGMKSSILYLHSPTVRPKYIVRLSEDPLIQDSLNGVLFWFTWYMLWHSTCGFPWWYWGNLCIGVDARFYYLFSDRNFGAVFDVLCVGWIDESEIVWCISYNHAHGYFRWQWSI